MDHPGGYGRRFFAVSLILSLALALAASGCRRDKSDGGGGAADAPRARATFTYLTDEPRSLDPLHLDDSSVSWLLCNIYQRLIKPGATGDQFEPDLAETWSVSPDGTAYTFNLRKDARFSDGTLVTARDVVFSLTRARDVKGEWQWLMSDVIAALAKDDHTVVISLKQASAPFLSYISLITSAILSADYLKGGSSDKLFDKPMGSGPYTIAARRKGESILLAANPHYYRKGYPKTSEVKLVYAADDNTRIIKLQSGEVDGLDMTALYRMDELDRSGQWSTQPGPWAAVSYLYLNNKTGPTANVDFRKALAYATDRETLVKVARFGRSKPATSFLPPNTFFFKKDLKAYTYDLDKAKEHMARSGVQAGTKIEIDLSATDPSRMLMATALKEMWSKLGLDVVLRPMDGASLMSRRLKVDFQVTTAGWSNDILDPSHFAEMLFGYKEVSAFPNFYSSPKMNELLAASRREMDVKKREAIYGEIQELVVEDCPCIWLYYSSLASTLSKKVEGFDRTADGTWTLENVVMRP